MRRSLLATVLGLIAFGGLGCVQQRPTGGPDHSAYRTSALFTPLDTDSPALPVSNAAHTPPPSTVANPDQEVRYLTLNEAFALALEQGTTGVLSTSSPGFNNDTLITLGGTSIFGTDSVRVLALNPAIAGADIEAALSKFDARWVTSMNWNTTDRPIGTTLDVLQTGDVGLDAVQSQNASFSTALVKPLPTGGVAGITFRTDYEYSNLSNPINPSYRPAVQFLFEQPLLQGFGVEINQIRSSHPGGYLTSFDTGGRVEGILITRLRLDQQQTEFERNIQFLLWNVEAAYWNLYGEYWNLYTREEALRQAYQMWRAFNSLAEAGGNKEDAAQARGQYERFRNQRVQALSGVLEAERRLRALLGLTRGDGRPGCADNRRLVPADTPTLAPFQPDWSISLHEALARKPELRLAQQNIRAKQYALINQKNKLLPDLRAFGTYGVNGLGSRLDGPGPDNALRSLTQTRYNDWTLGLRLDVPIGFRDANSAVRVAQLELTQAYLTLKDQEDKTVRFLELQYRQLAETSARIRISRAQRLAYAEELELRTKQREAGRPVPPHLLLESQRFWADALAEETRAIVEYNTALAGFEFARGTILHYDSVVIGEGPLPRCVEKRAVENAQERAKAVVVRERAAPIAHPACDPAKGASGLPQLPKDQPVSLPALFSNRPLLPGEPGM